MAFPRCSPAFAEGIQRRLFELGAEWAKDPTCPRLTPQASVAWSTLISDWVQCTALPLLVRRFQNNRGSCVVGNGGRTLVPTDNSPAQWAFAVAHSGECPSLDEIGSLLQTGRLPVAMALSIEERKRATYTGTRSKCVGTSEAGWKLAHIEGVALGRGSLADCPVQDVEAHFTRFLSPCNMLVVPAGVAGIAEVKDFIQGYCSVTGVGKE